MQLNRVSMACLMAVLVIEAGSALAAGGDAKLVALTATSQGVGSKELSCLLSDGCTGYWTPGTADHGLNEGIYLQFEDPEDVAKIEVVANAPVNISVNGDRMISTPTKSGDGNSTWSVGWDDAISVKSIFIGVDETDSVSTPLKIYSIAFFGRGGATQKLNIVSPSIVKATVQASSVLEPETAYQPANLFDSRYDFAWSTDGKKTKGIGEWVKVTFDSPQDISSIIFWNGYQRSDSHYLANGRIQTLSVTADQGQAQEIGLTDQMAPQLIKLEKPLKGATSIEFKISKIYPGAKYPDVLLSEVRFVDPAGRLILPRVALEIPKASANLQKWLDKSLSSKICGVHGETSYISSLDFRLRSDGSFVVYKNDEEGEMDAVRDQVIWEGNWQESDSKIRIFGKRYSTRIDYQQMAYGLAQRRSTAEIFQTDIKILPFASLAAAERDAFVARLIKSHRMEDASRLIVREMGSGDETTVDVTSATAKQVLLDLLLKSDATVIDSPLFADAFVPSDTGFCQRRW